MDCLRKSILYRFAGSYARRLGVALTVLLLISILVVPVPVSQAHPQDEILVTTEKDEWDEGAGCSLREAIQAANTDAAFGGCPAGSGADVIGLPAGTYRLTRPGAKDDSNASGDLDLDSDITINGAGQATTIVDGDELDRVLHVLGHVVSLNDLTITGGKAPDGATGEDGKNPGANGDDGSDGHHGGGILNQGTLTLTRCTVSDNRAGDGGSGGDGETGLAGADPTVAGGVGGDGGLAGDGGHGGGKRPRTLTLKDCARRGQRDGDGGEGGTGGTGGAGAPAESTSTTGGTGGVGGSGGKGGQGGDGGAVRGSGPVEMTDSLIRNNLCGKGLPGGTSGAGGDGGEGYSGGVAGPGGTGGIGGEGGDGADGGGGGVTLLMVSR